MERSKCHPRPQKKDSKSEVTNYRPILLLSCLGKVMERCMFKHVFNYFNKNNLLTHLQSGFTPGDSTVCQLADSYNTFCSALDNSKEVRVIFCDISKAFDRVWHEGLLHKRKQSNWKIGKAGVPQGSILGPLLFLIYINDIVTDIQSPIRLFADDTSLYIIVDNPSISANILNNDLSKINNWAQQWLVTFNPN
jgi:hypothetical protein